MFGLIISLLMQAIVLVVRLIAFLVLLIIRAALILIAVLVRLVTAIAAFVASLWAGSRGASTRREPIDPELRWAVFRRDGYACLHCGSESNLSVDHIFPVSRGGGNEPDNLQTLCRTCNSRKGALV